MADSERGKHDKRLSVSNQETNTTRGNTSAKYDFEPDMGAIRRRERGFYIGEVAEMFGVKVTTVRLWVRRGLLTPSRRTPTGHAIFSESDIRRAIEIGRKVYRERSERWNAYRVKGGSGGFSAKRSKTKAPNSSVSDSAAR